MIHPIHSLKSPLFRSFSLLDECFKLVESLGDNREVAILEEEGDDATLHVGTLLGCFGFKVFIDELWGVTHFHELGAHHLGLTGKLITLHDDFAFCVNIFADFLTLDNILPSVPEVSFSVFTNMH